MKASTKSKHNYWMVKQEPETYSWDEFVKDGSTDWSGVRNYQARNNLRAMKPGDKVLFYHSGKGKEVVGLAEVIKGAYPDPTADDPQWLAVDLKPVKPLANSVQLAAIRYDKRLSQLPLIRQSQLSVMPLTKDEFDVIVSMGTSKARKRLRLPSLEEFTLAIFKRRCRFTQPGINLEKRFWSGKSFLFQGRFDLYRVDHSLPPKVVIRDHVRFASLLGNFINADQPWIQFVERIDRILLVHQTLPHRLQPSHCVSPIGEHERLSFLHLLQELFRALQILCNGLSLSFGHLPPHFQITALFHQLIALRFQQGLVCHQAI